MRRGFGGETYTIGENTRESRSDATKKIEDRVSLSNLIWDYVLVLICLKPSRYSHRVYHVLRR